MFTVLERDSLRKNHKRLFPSLDKRFVSPTDPLVKRKRERERAGKQQQVTFSNGSLLIQALNFLIAYLSFFSLPCNHSALSPLLFLSLPLPLSLACFPWILTSATRKQLFHSKKNELRGIVFLINCLPLSLSLSLCFSRAVPWEGESHKYR